MLLVWRSLKFATDMCPFREAGERERERASERERERERERKRRTKREIKKEIEKQRKYVEVLQQGMDKGLKRHHSIQLYTHCLLLSLALSLSRSLALSLSVDSTRIQRPVRHRVTLYTSITKKRLFTEESGMSSIESAQRLVRMKVWGGYDW